MLIYLSARPDLSNDLRAQLDVLIREISQPESEKHAKKIEKHIRMFLFKLEAYDRENQRGREEVLRRLVQNLIDLVQKDTDVNHPYAKEFEQIKEDIQTENETHRLRSIQKRVVELAVKVSLWQKEQQVAWKEQIQTLAVQTLQLLRDPDEEQKDLNRQIDEIIQIVQRDCDYHSLTQVNRRLNYLLKDYPALVAQSRRERQELLDIIGTLIEALRTYQMGSSQFAIGVNSFLEELKKTRDISSIHRLRDSLIRETRQILDQMKQTSADSQKLHQRLLETQSRILVLEDELHQMRQKLAEALRAKDMDPLTELPNRRAFEQQLRLAVETVFRHKIPYALALMDIDHFKSINDQYGHPAGDEVLRRFARYVREKLRKIDFLARYGGEEFAAILPNTTAHGAFQVVERIRKGVEKLSIRHGLRRIHITFSAGICEMEAQFDEETWLEKADEALYEAKHSGRNRVVTFREMLYEAK
ncbi:MAG: diguanylate cyclase [candidate division KSB1 bacterium]|nr:diguanylate cyclase [candidate division KSB1 bacterium]MDQ7065166.1 diguanylate cyclase [candidate division KSB1 bacterium]